MNLIKCNNGHYYDGDKFDYCPHCAGIGSNDPAGDMTVSIDIIHIKKYINRCAKFDCKERRKKWMFNTRSTTGYAGI